MQPGSLRLRSQRPGTSVLIVDDDDDGREALARILRFAGYVVATCGNGGEALLHLKTTRDLPDVILLDLMMPVMDGRAFRNAQRQDASIAGIPVVIVSAQGDLKAALGADAYLDKPLEFRSLIDTIDRMVPLPSAAAV